MIQNDPVFHGISVGDLNLQREAVEYVRNGLSRIKQLS